LERLPPITILRRVLFGSELDVMISHPAAQQPMEAKEANGLTETKSNITAEEQPMEEPGTSSTTAIATGSHVEGSLTDIEKTPTDKLAAVQELKFHSTIDDKTDAPALSKAKFKAPRFTRPRLHLLAKQLHLPVEKVVAEAQEYCNVLARLEELEHFRTAVD